LSADRLSLAVHAGWRQVSPYGDSIQD